MNNAILLADYDQAKLVQTPSAIYAKYCSQSFGEELPLFINHNILSIVYSGQKKIMTQSGDFIVTKGEAFFLAKGQYVNSEIISENDYTSLVIMFDDHRTAKLFTQLPYKNYNTKKFSSSAMFKTQATPLIKLCADSIKLFIDHKTDYADEILELKLKEMMLLLLDSPYGESFMQYFMSSLLGKNDLKAFMEEHFDQNLSINEFAKLSGRSISAFKSEFKRTFGSSPMKWLLEKRLIHAKYLIEQMGYAIGQAAFVSGFKSHAHFSRSFREQFGSSPIQSVKLKNLSDK
jgi:AraC-like DNA-binding protein